MQRVLWQLVFQVVLALGAPGASFASGGGVVEVSRDLVRVSFEGPRKRPMPGGEADWAREVTAWENANRPVAEKALAAIEKDVLPRYRKKLSLTAKSFDGGTFKDISSEGVARGGGYDDSLWRLKVDLDLFPRGDIANYAVFVFKTRPSKADVRAFSRDVRGAALKTVGRTLPAAPTYRAFWLIAADQSSSLLLTSVPLASLQSALQSSRWRPIGFDTFRAAPALLITTSAKKFIVANGAGFLLANPTAAKFEPGETSVVLQVNGSSLPAMTVHDATRAEAVKLLDSPLDPALSAEAATAERARREDDIEFLSTLKPSLAK